MPEEIKQRTKKKTPLLLMYLANGCLYYLEAILCMQKYRDKGGMNGYF